MKKRCIATLCAAFMLLGCVSAYAAPASAVASADEAVVQPRAAVQLACSLTKYDSKQMKVYASAVANNDSVDIYIYAVLERYNGAEWVGVSIFDQSGQGDAYLQEYVSPLRGYRYRTRVSFFTDAGNYTLYSSELQW